MLRCLTSSILSGILFLFVFFSKMAISKIKKKRSWRTWHIVGLMDYNYNYKIVKYQFLVGNLVTICLSRWWIMEMGSSSGARIFWCKGSLCPSWQNQHLQCNKPSASSQGKQRKIGRKRKVHARERFSELRWVIRSK